MAPGSKTELVMPLRVPAPFVVVPIDMRKRTPFGLPLEEPYSTLRLKVVPASPGFQTSYTKLPLAGDVTVVQLTWPVSEVWTQPIDDMAALIADPQERKLASVLLSSIKNC